MPVEEVLQLKKLDDILTAINLLPPIQRFSETFEGTKLDATKWEGSGTATVANSILTLSDGASYKTKQTFRYAIVHIYARIAHINDIIGFDSGYAGVETWDWIRLVGGWFTVANKTRGEAYSVSYTPDTTNYHLYSIAWMPDECAFYVDGVLQNTYPQPFIPTDPLPIRLQAPAGQTLYVDSVIIEQMHPYRVPISIRGNTGVIIDPRDVSDRATRLLGVIYGSKGKQVVQDDDGYLLVKCA